MFKDASLLDNFLTLKQLGSIFRRQYAALEHSIASRIAALQKDTKTLGCTP